MNAKMMIVAGCLSIAIGLTGCTSMDGSCGGSYGASCGQTYQCCSVAPSPCQCTDPGCYQGNRCMSQGTCCRAFGNMGAG